jgi:transposase-like protein
VGEFGEIEMAKQQQTMVRPAPVQSVPVELEIKTQTSAPKAETRERKAGVGPKCPSCQSTNTFVTHTRAHPEFVQQRLRHYKCGACFETFKS